jgi:hypothetical protein
MRAARRAGSGLQPNDEGLTIASKNRAPSWNLGAGFTRAVSCPRSAYVARMLISQTFRHQ